MEIVEVSDWDADFRDRVVWKRDYHPNQVIETNIDGIHIRVIKDGSDRFYIGIENSNNIIIGAVELLVRNYAQFGRVLEPHSFLDSEYRGKGYVEGVYRWLLDNDFRLVSGDRQTVCSNGLWKKLSADYEFNYYDIWKDEVISEKDITPLRLECDWTRKTLKKVV